MFLPVNNMNVQGAINVTLDNEPDMSLCAPRPSSETFNSNNRSFMQQQTYSISSGPNSSQQFKANRTMDTKSRNIAERNVNTRNLHSSPQHADATNNLPKQTLPNPNFSKSAKKRKSSPTVKNSLPTGNAPLRQRSPSGGCMYPFTHANPQALSNCNLNLQQNNAAQNDFAVVTPLSTQMASVDASNKSIHNTKVNVLDVRSVPTNKHQRPSSGEPRINGAKIPVCSDESTSDSNCTSSPKLHSAVAEEKVSARSTRIQASETMPNINRTPTDSQRPDKEKTDRFSLIPVLEWPLDRLHTLVAMVEQIDNRHQKNVHTTDPGKEILKIYWNGDFCQFHDAVQTGIYQNIMEEVYLYCQKNEPVILRQIRSNKRNNVATDFHILKHNESPPKMMPYKSAWLNLNEKLDDIDKECGFSRFYRSFHSTPQEKEEHKASHSAHEKPSKLLDASDKLSPTEHIPVEEQGCVELEDTKSDSESLCENMPASLEPSQPVIDNSSPKPNSVVTEQANCQPNIVNPLKAMTNLVKVSVRQDVPTEMSVKPMLDDRFGNYFGSKSSELIELTSQSNQTNSPKLNPVVAEKEFVASFKVQNASSEKITINDGAVAYKSERCDAVPKPRIETVVQEIDKEDRVLERRETSGNESLYKNLTVSCNEQWLPMTDVNCSARLNSVVAEQSNCQLNTENPLKAITNLMTHDKRDASQREHQCSETETSGKSKLDDRFCNDFRVSLTDSISQRNHTSLTKLNLVVAEQQEFCNNEFAVTNNLRSEALPKPSIKLTAQINKEEIEKMTALASIQINVLPHEMSKLCFDGEMEDKDFKKDNAAPPEIMHKSSSLDACPVIYTTSAEVPISMEKLELNDTVDNESPLENLPVLFEQLPSLAKLNGVVAEMNNFQPNIVNPLKVINNLVNTLDKHVSKREHQHSTEISEKPKLNDRLSNGIKTSSHMLTDKSTCQSNYTRSTKLNSVVSEQQEYVPSTQIQNGSNVKMPNGDCTGTDKGVKCETVPKPSEEETDKVNFSTSIQIDVLPHEMAEWCFAGEMMEEKDLEKDNAAPPEIMRNSLLDTPKVLDTISAEEQISMERHEEMAKNSAQTIQSTLLDVPNKPSSTGHNLNKIIIANNIPVEEPASLELQEKNLDNERLSGNVPASLKQSLAAIDNHSPKLNDLVTEQTNSPLNFVNPLMTMTNLVRMLEKREVSLRRHQCQIGKQDVLNRTHRYSTPSSETSRLGDRFSYCAGAKSLTSTSQSDCTSSLKCNPVVGEKHELVTSLQIQNESNEKLPTRNCAGTDNCLREETEPKPSTGVVAPTKDSSASLKINVLPQEVAKRCFAGEMVEDKDLQTDNAAPPEIQHKSCRLHLHEERNKSFHDTPQIPDQTVNKILVEEQTYFKLNDTNSDNQSLHEKLPTSFKKLLPVTGANRSPELNGVVTELTNCQLNVVNPLEAMNNMVKKMEKRKVSIRKCLRQFKNEQYFLKRNSAGMSRLDDRFSNCAGAKSLVESTSQSDCTSSLKHNPVVTEQQEFVPLSQIQNEPKENMPHNDCSESVICETEPEPSAVAVDTLASVQINVLPHKMAEQWFRGEMEDQGLQKDNAGEDQLKVDALCLRSDTEVLIEDVKTRAHNNQSAVDDELESYCCLAKWFQTLQYGAGSSCKCQEKAELNEKGTKIEAHATNLEVPRTKDDCSNAFSNECGRIELEIGSPERMVENASESTEAKNLLMSHTNDADVDKIKNVKENSSLEEVFEVEKVTSEHSIYKSLSNCATNETLKCCEEKETPDPDSKRQKTKTACLSLYGSSSDGSNKVMPTKRSQVKESCQEPPETLRVTLSSHQKNEEKITSNKHKWFESLNNEDGLEMRRKRMSVSFATFDSSRISPPDEVTQTRVSEVTKENANALSSTSFRKLVSPSLNSKSKVWKGKLNNRAQQSSMNKFIVRGMTKPTKSSLQSPLTIMQSKYEMGNPALMPKYLEFKVLPKSFNFMEGTELHIGQADKSPNAKNEMPHPEDKRAKRTKTSHAPAQDAWRFSPLKTKNTVSNQATDVSGSGSLFQEYKKRFHDKKRENVSHQNLNSK